MNKVYQITESGQRELERELEELKSRRGEIADKIAAARDFGDLSENAEYDAAREAQGLLETRITEIETILQNASIIQAGSSSTVTLGSTVELEANGKTVVYTVVGPVEADPLEGKVSNESPIGQALMGKAVGDTVTISTPKGELAYTVVALR
ncbi:transcription elongation factor GreA [Candidatus Nanosynbacter lyticus]|uniref:transcription elongation factor GreA n=1 Tax=Candidatus Nanosynbacter lyticus TaxID=2093824 RepID=UPI0025532922|nr:transcription elongation factor GreA [Candidatus Nanosynbacter lyticus]WLD46598.1 transcription elongation factor GreA [Candidatus Nanosynbacter lyticus]